MACVPLHTFVDSHLYAMTNSGGVIIIITPPLPAIIIMAGSPKKALDYAKDLRVIL